MQAPRESCLCLTHRVQSLAVRAPVEAPRRRRRSRTARLQRFSKTKEQTSCANVQAGKVIAYGRLRASSAALEGKDLTIALVVSSIALQYLLQSPDASAFQIHPEPSNALSLPTWTIHCSSVLEWVTAMGLMWKYAEVSGNPRWKGMAWGMLPSLGGALAACTWHFFYNSTELDFLVTLQAFLTVLGNFTCWWAAYRIFKESQPSVTG